MIINGFIVFSGQDFRKGHIRSVACNYCVFADFAYHIRTSFVNINELRTLQKAGLQVPAQQVYIKVFARVTQVKLLTQGRAFTKIFIGATQARLITG